MTGVDEQDEKPDDLGLAELENYQRKVLDEIQRRQERLARIERELDELEQKLRQAGGRTSVLSGDAAKISVSAAYAATLRRAADKKRLEQEQAQADLQRAGDRLEQVKQELVEKTKAV